MEELEKKRVKGIPLKPLIDTLYKLFNLTKVKSKSLH